MRVTWAGLFAVTCALLTCMPFALPTIDVGALAISGEWHADCAQVSEGAILTNISANTHAVIEFCSITSGSDGTNANASSLAAIVIDGLGENATVEIKECAVASAVSTSSSGSESRHGTIYVPSGASLGRSSQIRLIGSTVTMKETGTGEGASALLFDSNVTTDLGFSVKIMRGTTLKVSCMVRCNAIAIIGDVGLNTESQYSHATRFYIDKSTVSATASRSTATAIRIGSHVRFGKYSSLSITNSSLSATAARSSAFGVFLSDNVHFNTRSSIVTADSTIVVSAGISDTAAVRLSDTVSFGDFSAVSIARSNFTSTTVDSNAYAVRINGGVTFGDRSVVSLTDSHLSTQAPGGTTSICVLFDDVEFGAAGALSIAGTNMSASAEDLTFGVTWRTAAKMEPVFIFSIQESKIVSESRKSTSAAIFFGAPMSDASIKVVSSHLSVNATASGAPATGGMSNVPSSGIVTWSASAVISTVSFHIANSSLAAVDGSSFDNASAFITWPQNISGVSPQQFDNVEFVKPLSDDSNVSAFGIHSGGHGPEALATLCLRDVRWSNGVAIENGPMAFVIPAHCRWTQTPTSTMEMTLSVSTSNTQVTTRSESAVQSPTKTLLPSPTAESKTQSTSATKSVTTMKTSTNTRALTTTKSLVMSKTKTGVFTPSSNRTTLSSSVSTITNQTRSMLQTVSETTASTGTLEVSNTSTVMVIPPTPAPKAVPQAVTTTTEALEGLGGLTGSVSPLVAGTAIRIATNARASTCTSPSRDDPPSKWPLVAQPLGFLTRTFSSSSGGCFDSSNRTKAEQHQNGGGENNENAVARPDILLIVANAFLACVVVIVVVACGVAIYFAGDKHLPGKSIRRDAVSALAPRPSMDPFEAFLNESTFPGERSKTQSAGFFSRLRAKLPFRNFGKVSDAQRRAAWVAMIATAQILGGLVVAAISILQVPTVAAAVSIFGNHSLLDSEAPIWVATVAFTVCLMMGASQCFMCVIGWHRWVFRGRLPQSSPEPELLKHRTVTDNGHVVSSSPSATSSSFHLEDELAHLREKKPVSGQGMDCSKEKETGDGDSQPTKLRRVLRVAQGALDNGDEWEPASKDKPLIVLAFVIWCHLVGDGRAPESVDHRDTNPHHNDERPTSKRLPEKEQPLLSFPFVDAGSDAGTVNSVVSTSRARRSWGAIPRDSDSDAAFGDPRDNDEPSSGQGNRIGWVSAALKKLDGLTPWRHVAIHGAWWLGVLEPTLSFLSGVATGIARAGFCVAGPWAAVVLQFLYVVVLLFTWPIKAPALYLLMLLVQTAQLVSLAVDIGIVLAKSDAEDAGQTAEDIADWSAFVVSLGLAIFGIAAIAAHLLKPISTLWSRFRAARAAAARKQKEQNERDEIERKEKESLDTQKRQTCLDHSSFAFDDAEWDPTAGHLLAGLNGPTAATAESDALHMLNFSAERGGGKASLCSSFAIATPPPAGAATASNPCPNIQGERTHHQPGNEPAVARAGVRWGTDAFEMDCLQDVTAVTAGGDFDSFDDDFDDDFDFADDFENEGKRTTVDPNAWKSTNGIAFNPRQRIQISTLAASSTEGCVPTHHALSIEAETDHTLLDLPPANDADSSVENITESRHDGNLSSTPTVSVGRMTLEEKRRVETSVLLRPLSNTVQPTEVLSSDDDAATDL